MRRKVSVFLALTLTIALFAASCAANRSDLDFSESIANGVMSPGMSQDFDYWGAEEPSIPTEPETDAPSGDGWNDTTSVAGQSVKPQRSLADKIIYSANVSMETVDFDGTVASIQDMLERYGAFLESSSVTGRGYNDDYYGHKSLRSANFVIRIPVESFNDMLGAMGDMGHVVNSYVYTENITEQYYDYQSRVDSYKIEQERLMDMLEKCETVADMIEIESRLSQVRYELESLESTLRNWQNQVDYSTINVNVSEVEELTRITEPHRTYWQQIGDGLRETVEDVGDFFKNLFKNFVIDLPVILIVAAFALVVILIAVPIVKKSRRRKAERQAQAIDADVEKTEKADKES